MSDLLKNKWVSWASVFIALTGLVGGSTMFVVNIEHTVSNLLERVKYLENQIPTIYSKIAQNSTKTSELLGLTSNILKKDRFYEDHISKIEKGYVSHAELNHFGTIVHQDHNNYISESERRVANQSMINSNIYQAILSNTGCRSSVYR